MKYDILMIQEINGRSIENDDKMMKISQTILQTFFYQFIIQVYNFEHIILKVMVITHCKYLMKKKKNFFIKN